MPRDAIASSRHGLHGEVEDGRRSVSNPIADPLNLQEKWQAILYGLGFLYTCLGTAMICEEYFFTALNELIEVKRASRPTSQAPHSWRRANDRPAPETCSPRYRGGASRMDTQTSD